MYTSFDEWKCGILGFLACRLFAINTYMYMHNYILISHTVKMKLVRSVLKLILCLEVVALSSTEVESFDNYVSGELSGSESLAPVAIGCQVWVSRKTSIRT